MNPTVLLSLIGVSTLFWKALFEEPFLVPMGVALIFVVVVIILCRKPKEQTGFRGFVKKHGEKIDILK